MIIHIFNILHAYMGNEDILSSLCVKILILYLIFFMQKNFHIVFVTSMLQSCFLLFRISHKLKYSRPRFVNWRLKTKKKHEPEMCWDFEDSLYFPSFEPPTFKSIPWGKKIWYCIFDFLPTSSP